jgi:hypothetical protein
MILIHKLSYKKKRTTYIRSNFTRIELVIAVAAIFMLLGLLLLSVSGRRKVTPSPSQEISCRNNLKIIGAALSSYAERNRGRIPPSNIRRYTGASNLLKTKAGKQIGLGILLDHNYGLLPENLGCPQQSVLTPERVAQNWNSGTGVFGAYLYRETEYEFNRNWSDDGNRNKAVLLDFNLVHNAHQSGDTNILYWDGHVVNIASPHSLVTDGLPNSLSALWKQADQANSLSTQK